MSVKETRLDIDVRIAKKRGMYRKRWKDPCPKCGGPLLVLGIIPERDDWDQPYELINLQCTGSCREKWFFDSLENVYKPGETYIVVREKKEGQE